MSAVGRVLRSGVSPQQVSGSLFGSGTLDIPVGVLSVVVTGAGCPGGTDYVYYPGQPYMAEVPFTYGNTDFTGFLGWTGTYTGVHVVPTTAPLSMLEEPTVAGQTPPYDRSFQLNGRTCWAVTRSSIVVAASGISYYPYRIVSGDVKSVQFASKAAKAVSTQGLVGIPAGYYWAKSIYESPIKNTNIDSYPFFDMDIRLKTNPTGLNQTLTEPIILLNTYYGKTISGSLIYDTTNYVSIYFEGQSAVPEVPSQPYIAPSETGGPYTGATVSATLNSTTKDWLGGYYTTPPVSATYTLTITGAGQTLSYSVPAGGQLNYAYEI